MVVTDWKESEKNAPMPLRKEDVVASIIKMYKLGMSIEQITEVVFANEMK